MKNHISPPKRIAIATHPSLQEAAVEADKIAAVLKKQGIKEWMVASIYDKKLLQQVSSQAFDVLIAVGGDGTMLRAGHLCGPMGLPIMGINVGHIGFLIELQKWDWETRIPDLLNGTFRLEHRMMLKAEHWRQGTFMGRWNVLNEVVVCRGRHVRPVHLQAKLDGYVMASYVADGLIAATATGSTAYALAVGGPIMPPELRNILIIPVAPHLSLDRAIILSEGVNVTLQVHTSHEAVMSVDGHEPLAMLDGDEIKVSASKHHTSFVRFYDPGNFYRNITQYMEQNPITGDINDR